MCQIQIHQIQIWCQKKYQGILAPEKEVWRHSRKHQNQKSYQVSRFLGEKGPYQNEKI